MGDEVDLQAERVLRPDLAAYRRFIGTPDRVLLPFALALVAGVVGRASSRNDLLWIGVLLAASAVLALSGAAGMLLTSRVRLGPGCVEYTRWWLRRTVIDLDKVTGLLATTTVSLSSRRVDLLVLREADGGLGSGSWAPTGHARTSRPSPGTPASTRPLTS